MYFIVTLLKIVHLALGIEFLIVIKCNKEFLIKSFVRKSFCQTDIGNFTKGLKYDDRDTCSQSSGGNVIDWWWTYCTCTSTPELLHQQNYLGILSNSAEFDIIGQIRFKISHNLYNWLFACHVKSMLTGPTPCERREVKGAKYQLKSARLWWIL